MRHEVEAALDQCLEWMRGGTALETCLSRYPEYASELRPLLETVTQVGRVLTPPASRTARAHGQERMLAALDRHRQERERLGPVAYALRQVMGALFRAPAAGGLAGKPIWQSALLSLVILIATGSGLALAASGYSLPGEALYPMKLARQELQVALTLDADGQASLQSRFEGQRRQEVELALAAGNRGEVHFAGTLDDVQPGQWTVAGLGVLVTAQTEVSAEPVLGTQVRVRGSLPGDGSLRAIELEILDDEGADTAVFEATDTKRPASPTPEPTDTPELEDKAGVATPEPADVDESAPATGATPESPDSKEPGDGGEEMHDTPVPGSNNGDDQEEAALDETEEPDDDDSPEATSTSEHEDSDGGDDNGDDDEDDDGDDDSDGDGDDDDVTPPPEPSVTPDD